MMPTPAFWTLTLALIGCSYALAAGTSSGPQTTERLYLSGRDKADAVEWDFRCSAGAKAGEWSRLPVPSNWELHGFGTLSYHSETPNEVGEYRHHFSLPENWEGRRLFLVFEGAMTDTTVRLNGLQVGETHRGGFYRFSYEVTGRVKTDSENLLEVTVAENSADESVNRAERTGDYWNFGGIFRPVWLESVPAQFIRHVATDARADGHLSVELELDGAGDADVVEVLVRDRSGVVVGSLAKTLVEKQELVRLEGDIEGVQPWTGESPNLYELTVQLKAEGQLRHERSVQIGFRTFELRKGDGFYLNGRRLILQGANRHSFHPDSGRCLSEADHLQDIRLIKEANMNAVRMSHYPPDERFLELCDAHGLYVLDELAGWQKSYSEEAGRPLARSMVRRDLNHPSILFWDNGNEGGWQTAIDSDYAKWDLQKRPVLHPWDVYSGVNTHHYRDYEQTQFFALGKSPGFQHTGKPVEDPEPLIFMPTEFLHALYDGGAGAGLEDYWKVMRQSPLAGGGFIWAWVDEGVNNPATGKIDVVGNKAPDGILGPYRQKEGSYFAIKDIWCPIQIREQSLPPTFDGVLHLENQYAFTDLKDCHFSWEVRALPKPLDEEGTTEILEQGDLRSDSILPGQSGSLKLPLVPSWYSGDVLALRATAPDGRHLWTWTWPLPGLQGHATVVTGTAPVVAAVQCEEKAGSLWVEAGALQVAFSKESGELQRVLLAGRVVSLGRPESVGGISRALGMEYRREGSDLLVYTRYEGSLSFIEWRIRTNGWVECRYAYTPGQDGACGLMFGYPSALVQQKTWVGRGPYRVWANRRRGTELGYWQNTYNDTATGWSGWEYPEFKGCFDGVRWLRLWTSEAVITVVPGNPEGSYVQVLSPAQAPAELQAQTAFELPQCGFALLDRIPAIGTKFTPTSKLGPSSQPQPLPGTLLRHFNLYFSER